MSSSTDYTPRFSGEIEFACGACSRLLKVPAHAAGRQAKCPQCGAVQAVPNPSASIQAGAGAAARVGPQALSTEPLTPLHSPAPAAVRSESPSAEGVRGSIPVANPNSPFPPLATGFKAPGFPAAPAPKANSLLSLRDGLREDRTKHEGSDTPTRRLFERITQEISKIYVGQEELVLGTLVALFSSGHVLIESVPGLGKTLFVRTLGRVLGCRFGRIQFTADLMPSDITGAPLFDMKTQEFRFRPGPIFTQLLLADEINRSPAKTHAALLEIMQEYRVTIDGTSHPIERPFLVLATQNPIESEGTYNLPEAQLDRFMFKLIAEYPQELEESSILKLHSTQADINDRLEADLQTITSQREILEITHGNSQIRMDDRLFDYINKIVRLTRHWPQFHLGASPRAGIALVQGARTLAAFAGRDYAVPDDVVQIALPALRHRVVLTAEAEVEGHKVDELLTEVVRSVEVPRI